ncbi:aldo/keto reductase [Arthrobacter sp. GAS37]|uniref:aldo/keto reductase n=1 Tax=Arthrobacter sp. GAS37 TaxID=3156261 RepID=UPI003850F6AC
MGINLSTMDACTSQLHYGPGFETALETIRRVLEGPFNFIDANGEYWQGAEGERCIGRAISEAGGLPDGFVLTRSVGPALALDFSGDGIVRAVEESLQRLGLDLLPLVLLRKPEEFSFESATARSGALATLVGLRDQGLINHLGIAGGPIDLQLKYLQTDAFDAVISHVPYNLLDRAAEPLIQNAVSREVAFVNAAPFTGRLLLDGEERSTQGMNRERGPARLERSDKMRLICAAYGIPLAAAALQFSTLDPRVASTIVGASTPSKADFVTDLAQWRIPSGVWDDLLDLVEESELAISCRDDVVPTTDPLPCRDQGVTFPTAVPH